ncbi:hypothetical protein M2266_006196 [Streptomyces sp. SPB162]|nr:hypothetical protein [Streptomyces sp. SPB162]
MEHRVEEDPVRERVDPARGVQIGGRSGQRPDRGEVEREGDLGRRRQQVPQHADGPAVGEVQVVRGPQRGGGLGAARRVHPLRVPQEGAAPRLVERRPGRYPVAEGAGDDRRVVGEPVGGLADRPAARVLQLLRQVPVVERQDGPDTPVQQLVDQRAVEVQPLLQGGAAPGGLDARPGHGQPVVGQAEF